MFDSFYRMHQYLVERTQAPIRRALMDEIDWHKRLIGIKGSRGVGRTTFLLQYAKENSSSIRSSSTLNGAATCASPTTAART